MIDPLQHEVIDANPWRAAVIFKVSSFSGSIRMDVVISHRPLWHVETVQKVGVLQDRPIVTARHVQCGQGGRAGASRPA